MKPNGRLFRTTHLFSAIACAALFVILLPGPVFGQACTGGYCGSGEGVGSETKVEVHVTITVSPADAGIVFVNGEEPTSGVFKALQGDVLELEAVPNSGYTFAGWSDWFTESDNTVEAPLYNHKTLTASFSRVAERPAPVESDDATVIGVPGNITALDRSGNALSEVSVELRLPRALPSSAVLIGDVHLFKPDGATFDPPLPIALSYDIDSLPAGVAEEELSVAMFDADSQDWILLPSIVDSDGHIVMTEVTHFSEFAVVAPGLPGNTPLITPGFSFSSLVVTPGDPYAGQDVTVNVIASYAGFNAQAHSRVFVLLDGAVADETEIVLSPGDQVAVGLTVTPPDEGAHTVEVNGLVQTFAVAGQAPASALSQAVALADEGFQPLETATPSLLSRAGPVALVVGGLLILLLAGPLIGGVRRRILRYRYDL